MYTIGGQLYHHGVLGQKWGQRNGPPYPLSKGAHSASERKAGYTKSIGGGRNESLYDRKTSDKQVKKTVKQASKSKEGVAAEIITAAITVAAYATPFLILKGKQHVDNKKAQKKLDEIRSKKTTPVDEKTGFHKKTSKMTPEEDLKHVNPAHSNSMNTNMNCVLCTATYEMRRRGYDVSAELTPKPLMGRDEIKKMFPGSKVNEMNSDWIKDKDKIILDTSKYNEYSPAIQKAARGQNTEHARKVINTLQKEKNSRGALFINWGLGGGHAVAYEVKNGKLTIRDGQSGKSYSGDDALVLLSQTWLAANMRLDNVDFDSEAIKRAMK